MVIGVLAFLVVLGVAYYTLMFARQEKQRGNTVGAFGILLLTAVSTVLSFYLLFLRK